MTNIAMRLAGAIVIGFAGGQLIAGAPLPGSWPQRFALGCCAALYEPALWMSTPPFNGSVQPWLSRVLGQHFLLTLLFDAAFVVGSGLSYGNLLPLLMMQMVLLVALGVGLARQVLKGPTDLRFRLYLTLMGTMGLWVLGALSSAILNPEAPDTYHALNGSLLTLPLAAWTAIRLRNQRRERHSSGVGMK